MSMPEVPNIDINQLDAINAMVASIAMEELAMSHILNAEGEKIQYVLGTLEGSNPGEVTIDDVLEVNKSVQETFRNVIRNQMLLHFKLEDIIALNKVREEEPEYQN